MRGHGWLVVCVHTAKPLGPSQTPLYSIHTHPELSPPSFLTSKESALLHKLFVSYEPEVDQTQIFPALSALWRTNVLNAAIQISTEMYRVLWPMHHP